MCHSSVAKNSGEGEFLFLLGFSDNERNTIVDHVNDFLCAGRWGFKDLSLEIQLVGYYVGGDKLVDDGEKYYSVFLLRTRNINNLSLRNFRYFIS